MIDSVFFDRDGTLIKDKHYLGDPEGVELLSGVGKALAGLAVVGVRLFVVSNQSGIGRGFFSEDACLACQARLAELLSARGAPLTGMAYCPHAPEQGCACRKPALGMWRALQAKHGLCPERCVMVGDKREDAAFGLAAGFVASILVLTGQGREHAAGLGLPVLPDGVPFLELQDRPPHWPHVLARDVPAAVAWVARDREAAA
jgi:D-glycero-D-manno-heptose 1,7-bisphosphate phosphatase